jgi:hypothetical protein
MFEDHISGKPFTGKGRIVSASLAAGRKDSAIRAGAGGRSAPDNAVPTCIAALHAWPFSIILAADK